MKTDNELVEAAIMGGLVGAALEALISNGKKNTGLGILAGAVIAASLKANAEAVKTNIPLVLEENNILYEVNADGTKIFNFATGISLLLFYAFAMQCISTLAVVKKETNSWKWPIIQLVFMSGFAYLVAFLAYQILK